MQGMTKIVETFVRVNRLLVGIRTWDFPSNTNQRVVRTGGPVFCFMTHTLPAFSGRENFSSNNLSFQLGADSSIHKIL